MQWLIQVFITGQPSNNLEGKVQVHCWWPVSIEDLCYDTKIHISDTTFQFI